jgi:hypothetical protein
LKLAVRECGERFSEKAWISDDHFDPQFSFMGMKGLTPLIGKKVPKRR